MSDTVTITRDFSPAVERLFNFVAISHLQKGDEVLRQLLLQCLGILPDERFDSACQFQECLDVLFGLQIHVDRLQTSIDQLVNEGKLCRPTGTTYTLNHEVRLGIQERIDHAVALQERVKAKWLEESTSTHPQLDPVEAWVTLQKYLSQAFQRHGMQTIALLDASLNTASTHSDSLRSILQEVLKNAGLDQKRYIEASIMEFFAAVGKDRDRTDYIVQLADGAFSYCSLTVPPDVASQLRDRLQELTLFLDTNFLFGILDLHINPLVDVSHELLNAIQKHHLPFKLRYHESTQREMEATIQSIADDLRTRHWPQPISRAIVKSGGLSGMEQRYHERNAVASVDVDTFFKPYDHLDVLLKDQSILIYRGINGRTYQQAELLHEYEEFLLDRGKEKPYRALQHDAVLLDCVQQMRSNARSSLEAKALCITCDYLLYRFDWEMARRNGHMACTVLPNQFLQLLRPFIPASVDFDRSFAETFAIPEFRTLNSGAAAAYSRMLSLLTTYKGLREETVSAMLANDMLLDRLRHAKTEVEFQGCIESAIITENSLLLEERVALAEQLKRERSLQDEKVRILESDQQRLLTEKQELQRAKTSAQRTIEESASTLEGQKGRLLGLARELDEQQTARQEAEQRAGLAEAEAGKIRQRFDVFATVIGASAGVLFVVLAEQLLTRLNWQWLLLHPNSYGIRAAAYVAGMLFFLGLFRPSWRTRFWGSGTVSAIVSALITLLGGPKKP
jgi:hypothetical protein